MKDIAGMIRIRSNAKSERLPFYILSTKVKSATIFTE